MQVFGPTQPNGLVEMWNIALNIDTFSLEHYYSFIYWLGILKQEQLAVVSSLKSHRYSSVKSHWAVYLWYSSQNCQYTFIFIIYA